MPIVLVTGMSGAGKSAVLAELGLRGHAVVETDVGDWCETELLPDGSRVALRWREDRIDALLAAHGDGHLFVSGTVPNQGAYYDRFDAVVLLSAPLEVLLERVRTRETNDFGKSDAERARIVADHAPSSRCCARARRRRSILADRSTRSRTSSRRSRDGLRSTP